MLLVCESGPGENSTWLRYQVRLGLLPKQTDDLQLISSRPQRDVRFSWADDLQ